MKMKVSGFFKHIISVLTAIAKSKSMAIKNKTSAAKARLVIFSLMKNKKFLFGSISSKIHSILHHKKKETAAIEDQNNAIVLYNSMTSARPSTDSYYYYDDHEDSEKYPDLTHSLFEEEDQDDIDQAGSVIDIVRNSKEGGGQNFKLEDEIDQVADLFIRRFHKQMRLQKLHSFKRFQEMIARGT